MNNKHERKFIINIEIGLILTISGISAIVYIAYPINKSWMGYTGPSFRPWLLVQVFYPRAMR